MKPSFYRLPAILLTVLYVGSAQAAMIVPAASNGQPVAGGSTPSVGTDRQPSRYDVTGVVEQFDPSRNLLIVSGTPYVYSGVTVVFHGLGGQQNRSVLRTGAKVGLKIKNGFNDKAQVTELWLLEGSKP